MTRLGLLPTLLTYGLLFQVGGQSARANTPHFYKQVKVLCVASNTYDHLRGANLEQAEADAKRFGEALKQLFGYQPIYLLNSRATKDNILASIREAGNSLGVDEGLIVYLALHGTVLDRQQVDDGVTVRTRQGFILGADAAVNLENPNDSGWDSTALEMKELVETLDSVKAHHVLLVADCCCSGFLTKRGLNDFSEAISLLKSPSRTLVAATTQREEAADGVFTPQLIEILTQYSRSIEPASVTDVFADVRERVSEKTERRMTPQLAHFGDQDGEFIFFPLSIPQEDVASVRREVNVERERVASSDTTPGRLYRGILSGVIKRANERAGRRTDMQAVVAAITASNYWYGADPAAKLNFWQEMRERFRANAAWNDPLAMAGLHFCYARGLGEAKPNRDPDAAYRMAVAATQVRGGEAIGKYLLGRCYRHGLGVPQNDAAGRRLYEQSAAAGFILGELAYADLTLRNSPTAADGRSALGALEKGARQNIASAHLLLGDVYATGQLGADQDLGRAIAHYENAVRLGALLPTPSLYDAYTANLPGFPPRDRRKAEKYLREGAEAGVARAQFWLAVELLQHPKSTRVLQLGRNPTEGMKWLELAGRQQFGPALVTLARIYGLGQEPTVAMNFNIARKFNEQAIEMNEPDALILKGAWSLEEGGPYPLDEGTAFACFQLAAERRDPVGCEQLGRCYEAGIGIDVPQALRKPFAFHPQSHVAFHWYGKALDYGESAHALERLKFLGGVLRLEKRGIPFGSGRELEPSDVLRRWENAFPDTAGTFKAKFVR